LELLSSPILSTHLVSRRENLSLSKGFYLGECKSVKQIQWIWEVF
jgi:hypothetical protein